jgi:hypothetical protein
LQDKENDKPNIQDSEEEFEFNDSFNPDLRKTPIAKKSRLGRTAKMLRRSFSKGMDIAVSTLKLY